MRQLELLAPAGSFEAMRAAINAGADAVYIGGQMFSARASANNFNTEEVIKAIAFCHTRGKKLYLAVNTLLKKSEITKLTDYLRPFYENGIDAIIVQDMGVLQSIRAHFPDLPIHGSTQMTIQSSEGAKFIKELGAERIVLSRELNLKEISKIKKENDIEIECFVHGALCYCYSGQCLMSSMIGGRSGNRGRCAQSCRMPYQVLSNDSKINKEKEDYVLSPKDICTLEIIPDLVEAGIDSFKIEGRMKRPEYVAGVVSIYRNYMDRYLRNGRTDYKVEPADLMALQDLYNRGGFSSGYFKTKNGKEMMSTVRPNHWGTKIGKVVYKGNKAFIKFEEQLNKQDSIEIWGSNDNVDFITKDEKSPGQTLDLVSRRGITIPEGAPVYRTKNEKLLKELQETYLKNDVKVKIRGFFQAFIDQPMSFTVEGLGTYVTVDYGMVQMAQSRPTLPDKIREQLSKTGTTPFDFEMIEINTDESIFLPIQELNEIRRLAIGQLEAKLIGNNNRKRAEDDYEMRESQESQESYENHENHENNYNDNHQEWKSNVELKSDIKMSNRNSVIVSVLTDSQFDVALQFDEVDQINYPLENINKQNVTDIVNRCIAKNTRLLFTMPPLHRTEQQRFWNQTKELLFDLDFTGFSLKLLDQIQMIKQEPALSGKEIALEPNVYVINEEAKLQFNQLGIDHFTASHELNGKELEELQLDQYDVIVYGYVPVMVSAQCVNKTCHGCDKIEKTLFLEDRYNKKFAVKNFCEGCYNIIYNSQPTNLYEYVTNIKELNPRGLRLDFSVENDDISFILKAFTDQIKYNKKTNFRLDDFTRGHYKRGIE